MGRKKKENDDRNMRNQILGSPKVIRLMKLWKVPVNRESEVVEFDSKDHQYLLANHSIEKE